ncbi:His Kinase A (phospho-acceptor) domain-containing protein [Tangfeifania diversioriginum]|uniref:histidine kinase n=1 Tax=Tangfeifania diversioriginum TaxID=1168035 RepID=A0A1M6MRT2_9BACT|nr:hybrid sensor histidine kinase/response regulator [Tangfeifania diversioriginum]SHJ86235.1 His Kinase A (phospho-acceptor) domain-containing protein [Tangfeifania diversioriginum]
MIMKNKDLILIVDDQPNNLKVISSVLGDKYSISVANSGENALKILNKVTPQLILLDIMMPGMNGFEVCEKLKANEGTKEIPVIFLTAKTEISDLVKGFNYGAVDYITKPFNATEVKVRINNHLSLAHAKSQIKAQKKDLQEKNRALKKLMNEKDKFFSIIAHDLKSPFSGLLGMLELMNDEGTELTKEETKKLLPALLKNAENVYALVENLLEWSRLQRNAREVNSEKINPQEVVNEVLGYLEATANQKQITLINEVNENHAVFADRMMFNTILRNLISNALKFTREGGKITVASETEADGKVTFSVTDTGIGMDSKTINEVFSIDKNVSTPGTKNEKGTGLGLILCKEFIELQKGEIRIKSKVNEGTCISFTLPKN